MTLTDADIACVWGAYNAFSERFEAMRADADLRREYFAEFYVSDAVMDNSALMPAAAPHVGADGYVEWFEESVGHFDGVAWDVESVEAVGERVASTAWIRGREPSDGTLLELHLGMLYTMREGRIAHVQVFTEPERAFHVARSD